MGTLDGLLAASLFVSPGAWLAFTLCAPAAATSRTRWALAVLLSPACLALEVVALAAVGVSFENAVPILPWVNLGALALPLVRRATQDTVRASPAWLTLAVWLVLIAPIAFFWWRDPVYRVYGWHNAMNSAMCYRIAALPLLPEDPDLAGVRLNYGWLGHVQLSAIAWRTDLSPTLVFPWLNALMLLVTLVFMEASMSALSPRRRACAPLTAALVLAGTMMSIVVLELAPSDSKVWARLTGDVRLGPLLAKFHNFDMMVIGLAGLAALVYFVVASWTQSARRTWVAMASALAAIGLSYPILFPFAGIPVAVVFLSSFGRRRNHETSELDLQRWWLAGACVVVGAAVLAYVSFLGQDAVSSFLTEFRARGLAFALATMLHVLGPWVWIAWPELAAGWRARAGVRFQLLMALMALVGVALLLQMKGGTHYKVYFAQVAVLAPLLVTRIDGWCERWPRGALATLGAGVLALSVGTAIWIHGKAPSPPQAENLPLDETAFWLQARAPLPAFAWIETIRKLTDDDAIVVAAPSWLPLAALTARSQYISLNKPGVPILGYSFASTRLFKNRCYPPTTIAARQRVIEACFQGREGESGVDFENVTRELRALGREVVIVFPAAGGPYLEWLRARATGVELERDDMVVLWRLGS